MTLAEIIRRVWGARRRRDASQIPSASEARACGTLPLQAREPPRPPEPPEPTYPTLEEAKAAAMREILAADDPMGTVVVCVCGRQDLGEMDPWDASRIMNKCPQCERTTIGSGGHA